MILLLWFGLPGVLGICLAKSRGKNILIWGLLSAVFPFFLFVLYFQYKPLKKNLEPPT